MNMDSISVLLLVMATSFGLGVHVAAWAFTREIGKIKARVIKEIAEELKLPNTGCNSGQG